MNNYELKDKIIVTEEFIADLISSSWLEVEAIQHQINSIDTDTPLGAKVAKLLKNACTNQYVLIGCLESLAENHETEFEISAAQDDIDVVQIQETNDEAAAPQETACAKDFLVNQIEPEDNFEPFEYFVDFDDPSGEPVSDEDLYSK